MQKKKGISLIVLVITIIVMIILAAAIILTLNNAGIIGEASDAVEKTNEKQMKELVTMAWAEAYLKDTTATKDDAYYYGEIVNYLKANGITDEELAKYTITATTQGADVSLRAGLNEWGFYYDKLYLGTAAENALGYTNVGLVFHADGSAEGYAKIDGFGDELYCVMAFEAETLEYSKNTIAESEINTNVMTASQEGKKLQGTIDGIGMSVAYTDTTLHSIYYNKAYTGRAIIDGAEVLLTTILNADKSCTMLIRTLDGTVIGTKSEVVTVAARDYVLAIPGSAFGVTGNIPCCVSTDGDSVLVGRQFVMNMTDEVIEIPDITEEPEIVHNVTIPDGGTYYVGVTSNATGDYTGYASKLTAGNAFPTSVSDGDVYVYGDYEYRYNKVYFGSWITPGTVSNGWGVRVKNAQQTSYGQIVSQINSKSVTNMVYTFYNCSNLTDLSSIKIPSGVKYLTYAFLGCAAEDASALKIPSGVASTSGMFSDCKALKKAPNMSACMNLTDMSEMFFGCTQLTGTIEINANPTNCNRCFANTAQPITITGSCSSTTKANLAGTATNGNVTY